jgi:hypothetical protein
VASRAWRPTSGPLGSLARPPSKTPSASATRPTATAQAKNATSRRWEGVPPRPFVSLASTNQGGGRAESGRSAAAAQVRRAYKAVDASAQAISSGQVRQVDLSAARLVTAVKNVPPGTSAKDELQMVQPALDATQTQFK